MKIFAAFLMLVAAAASPGWAAGATDVTSAQAKGLLAKNSRIVLLDVRTPEEHRQARLRGSLLIPVGELAQRAREIPKDRPVLIYCAVGSRSVAAAGFLASKGHREIYNMSDGLVGWYRNGFPLEGAAIR